MNAILAFKNLEKEDVENCPCSEEYRDRMKEFHQSLTTKVAVAQNQEEDEDVNKTVHISSYACNCPQKRVLQYFSIP